MIRIDNFEMIAVDDEFLSESKLYEIKDDGDVVSVPLRRLGHIGIWCLTVALAVIATPFCYFVASSLQQFEISGQIPVAMEYTPILAWFFAVFGPVAVYYALSPLSWFNPKHFLLYDRRTQQFSFHGGYYRWHRNQIIGIVAIAGSRMNFRRRRTELQICVNEQNQLKKYLIFQTAQSDPETAFGKIVREFALAMSVPAYFARLMENGSLEVQEFHDASSKGT